MSSLALKATPAMVNPPSILGVNVVVALFTMTKPCFGGIGPAAGDRVGRSGGRVGQLQIPHGNIEDFLEAEVRVDRHVQGYEVAILHHQAGGVGLADVDMAERDAEAGPEVDDIDGGGAAEGEG